MPIPTSVKSIGTQAFAHCTGLTEMIIPDSVESIGPAILYCCDNLTTLTVPFVGSSQECTSTNKQQGTFHQLVGFFRYYTYNSYAGYVSSGGIPSKLVSVRVTHATQIADDAFTRYEGSSWIESKLTSLTLNDGITSIGENAFYGQSELTSLLIPSSVTSIGSGAFSSCSKVTDLVIPDGVTVINPNTFYGCSSLKQMPIPTSVKSIGTQAFAHCTGLTEMIIPDSVESIGPAILYCCDNLTTLTVPFVGSSQECTSTNKQQGTFHQLMIFFPVLYLQQ